MYLDLFYPIGDHGARDLSTPLLGGGRKFHMFLNLALAYVFVAFADAMMFHVPILWPPARYKAVCFNSFTP